MSTRPAPTLRELEARAIESWGSGAPFSEHPLLEVAAAFQRRRGNLPPAGESLTELTRGWNPGEPTTPAMREYLERTPTAALPPGAQVPGCSCPTCTGLPADHPARLIRRPPGDLRPVVDVDRARAVSVLEVVHRLGCGEPIRRGRELHVRCPLHEDSEPSLRIHRNGRWWYCDPCGEGGDAIRLYMRGRQLDFITAVRELAAGVAGREATQRQHAPREALPQNGSWLTSGLSVRARR